MKIELCLVFLCLLKIVVCIEPITMTVGAIAAGVFGWKYDTVLDYTYCLKYECCNDKYIPAKASELKYILKEKLYGQHIIVDTLFPAIQHHYSYLKSSMKPLVLSFHGTPGTGKNFVSDLVAKSIFLKGSDSNFVHKFSGRLDFPLDSEVHIYKVQLKQKIFDAVGKCPRSLFIFDEVDKMPPGVFDTVKTLLDHHSNYDNKNFRHAVFIFLSNTGGVQIAETLGKQMSNGVLREDTKLFHFEKVTEMAAYNMAGGLNKASIIESNLIDHYLPFLPLEKRHVEQCIAEEFRQLGMHNPKPELVKEISSEYVSYQGLFATYGCKRISKKVGVAFMLRR